MRSLKITIACIIPVVLLACMDVNKGRISDSTVSVATSKPLTAKLVVSNSNSLIMEIVGTVDKPGHVYAEYWTGLKDRLRTRSVKTDGTSYSINIVRLRAETNYNFQVFGADSDGNNLDGPTGVFRTGSLPQALQDAEFLVLSGRPTNDLTYLEFRQASFRGLVAIDGEGYIIWYYSGLSDEEPYVMDRRDDGNIVYLSGGKRVVAKGLVEINPLGQELHRLEDICPPNGPIHHEVSILDDGRVMYLSRDVLRPGFGHPPVPQEGDTIGIWDPRDDSNQIVWNIFDFIPMSHRVSPDSDSTLPDQFMWGGCDRDPSVQDWSHGNSVKEAWDGTVIISLRHLDQIIAIDEDFQSIKWRPVSYTHLTLPTKA